MAVMMNEKSTRASTTSPQRALRRVLIVSPHFPPINAPDYHRIRMSLPFFSEYGWEAAVLAINPKHVEGALDPALEKALPADLKITRAGAVSPRLTRKFGMGNLGLRSLPHLKKCGDQLLDNEHFDLVYFSTTMFPSMILGPRWLRRFGVPYVLDFQDPWVTDYYDRPGAPVPPGGWRKYRLSAAIARHLEPRALACPSHIITVSEAYPRELQSRYNHLRDDQFTVLPFGAPVRDFALADELNPQQTIFNPDDGLKHWLYVGVVGDIMKRSLRILFGAIASMRRENPGRWTDIRLHFVGTSYASGGAEPSVTPIAHEYGVADLVHEQVNRVPYFTAIRLLKDSTLVLMIGSDEASYNASKLYPCILSRRPILALFHEESLVVKNLAESAAGRVAIYGRSTKPEYDIRNACEQLEWALKADRSTTPDTNWSFVNASSDREMTRRQCEIFDSCVQARIT